MSLIKAIQIRVVTATRRNNKRGVARGALPPSRCSCKPSLATATTSWAPTMTPTLSNTRPLSRERSAKGLHECWRPHTLPTISARPARYLQPCWTWIKRWIAGAPLTREMWAWWTSRVRPTVDSKREPAPSPSRRVSRCCKTTTASIVTICESIEEVPPRLVTA